MDGQMTIFDLMPLDYPSIEDVTEEELAQIIGDALGVRFVYMEFFDNWQAKTKKMRLDFEISNYQLADNHNKFIGCGYTLGTSGGGAPRDSVEDAIKWFKMILEREGGKNE